MSTLSIVISLLGLIAAALTSYIFTKVLPKEPPRWVLILIIIAIVLIVVVTPKLIEGTESDTIIELPIPLECTFIDEVLKKSELIEWIDTPLDSGSWSGVQVETNQQIVCPNEWEVDIGSNDTRLCPLEIPKNTLVSIYAPYKCRPLAGP